MGQTLAIPAVEKETETGQDERFAYCITAMQGWRISMEDSHAVLLKLDEGSEKSNAFFAVYDGHGGSTVAQFAGQNVHKRLLKEEAYQEKRYSEAMKRAFLGTDEDLLADPQYARDTSGCTAVAALVTEDKIYVANAGDSRSVICTRGEVKPLSFDHKPTNDGEKKRIVNGGGYVEAGRVNGNLALSRGIGDFNYKKNYSLKPEDQIITSDPEITVHDITEDDEFFVIACDGIWDCLESQEVVDFIRHLVAEGKSLTEISELMCDHCIAPDTSAGTGCDNMTIMIIALLHGRTLEEWQEWVKDRVEKGIGYKTRRSLPSLYSEIRKTAFWKKMKEFEEQGVISKWSKGREGNSIGSGSGSSDDPDSFGSNTIVLGSSGGISFQPGGSILSDSGRLMFDHDDDDDGMTILGLGGLYNHSSLRARLEAFEMEDDLSSDEEGKMSPTAPDDDSDPSVLHSPPSDSDTGSTLLPNGDAAKLIPPVEQLSPLPSGDAADPVTRIEGMLDTSENPLKT